VLYKGSVAIPAGTMQASAVVEYLQLSKGTISNWLVQFPPGCAALAHVAVLYHEQKILPAGEADSLAWDGYTYEAREQYEVDEEPYELKIIGWNEDTSYQHTIAVAVELFPTPDVTTEGLLERMLRAFIGGA
jgi:hypothetical protein